MGDSIDDRLRRELASAASRTEVISTGGSTEAASADEDSGTRRTEPATPKPRGPAAATAPPARPHARGDAIGRFLVLDKVGTGGMAVVLSAYDPTLDRKVAIKVLRGGAGGEPSPVRRQRLAREAQAMAKLRHDNVVTVFEAGELDDGLFIAMELVEGVTLKQWLRAATRSWREVLAVMQEAGAGLAAAHAAGLVHRDFKPDNVLVDREGRARVTDFGIVAIQDPSDPAVARTDPEPELTPDSNPNDSGSRLTDHGARLGTPPYMAPEQHAGGTIDARTDQFAFCVTLWEGLYGKRPFPETNRRALVAAITAGKITPPLEGAKVPRWLHRVVLRGLSTDPSARYPTMTELLAALAADPIRRRRRVAVGVAVVGAAVAGALATALALVRAPDDPCRPAPERLAGVWDPDVRATIERGFLATGVPYAAFTSQRLGELIDARARDWVAMRVDACRATARGEQSGELLDARMRCLDRRRQELAALTRLYATGPASAELVAAAVQAVGALPPLDACADLDALRAAVPPPATRARAEAVADLRRRLADAGARLAAGAYHAARELASAIERDAARVEYPAVWAEALFLRGQAEAHDGDPRTADATLGAAAETAARVHDDALVADAIAELVWAKNGQSHYDEALALAAGAMIAATRAGGELRRAAVLIEIASAQEGKGDLAAAQTALAEALAVRERLHPDSTVVAQTLNHLGNLLDRLGKGDQARAAYERSLTLARAQLGEAHPSVAVTMANLCNLDLRAGKIDVARSCQERALAILTAALGDRHPTVGWATNDLALILEAAGDRAAAEDALRRALAIAEATGGADHPDVAWPLINLGGLANDAGRGTEALATCQRAARVIEAASGPEHPDLAFALGCLGEAQRITGDARDAVATLRRAVALFERSVADPDDLATARYSLARALVDAHGDRREAIAIATAAAAALTDLGPDTDQARREIGAWIARQRER